MGRSARFPIIQFGCGKFPAVFDSSRVGVYGNFKNVRAIPAALAFRAADENVAEELHFNFFKTGAAAAFTLALRGIETEGAGAQTTLLRQTGRGEEFANVVERADIDGRVGARRFAQAGLIDQNDAAERFPAGQCRLQFTKWKCYQR